jgi:NAD(P)-dependent dehydrogenase (short-subunit alcohol dehydrogenase family)
LSSKNIIEVNMKKEPMSALNHPAPNYIRFPGQVAVITGAGGGLGRVYALELARRGAKIVVNDPGPARDGDGASQAPADQVVLEIQAAGGAAIANYDSVASPEGGQAIIQSALDAYGRIDILIHNAGILRDKTIANLTPDLWDPVLSVHLDGAYHVTRPAFLAMKQQGYGRILLTTSTSGLFGNFGQANYGAAKMGMVGLMNCLKLEAKKHDIRMNCIAPTAVTRMTEDLLPPDLQELLKPEMVAPLVLLLASEHCPANGEIYCAGGGYYGRIALVAGEGAWVAEGSQIPTPEMLAAAWERISSIYAVREQTDANQALLGMLSSRPSAQHDSRPKEVPEGLTVSTAFAGLENRFNPEKAQGLEIVYQFVISGNDGGEWQVIIKDRKCNVLPGWHDNPVTILKMEERDFLLLVSGCQTASETYASGKLTIEGKPGPAQRLERLFQL